MHDDDMLVFNFGDNRVCIRRNVHGITVDVGSDLLCYIDFYHLEVKDGSDEDGSIAIVIDDWDGGDPPVIIRKYNDRIQVLIDKFSFRTSTANDICADDTVVFRDEEFLDEQG